MQLSKNFTLDEFLISQTAERHSIDMTPDDEVIGNLSALCTSILQPLRDLAGSPLVISSGYRPLQLNTRIGGSKTSAHVFGRAADLHIVGMTPYKVCEILSQEGLPYDQNILEFWKWTHVGIADDPRNEDLTAYAARLDNLKDNKNKTKYVFGIQTKTEVLDRPGELS